MIIRFNDNVVTVTLESGEEEIQIETVDKIIGNVSLDPLDNMVKFSGGDSNSIILGGV